MKSFSSDTQRSQFYSHRRIHFPLMYLQSPPSCYYLYYHYSICLWTVFFFFQFIHFRYSIFVYVGCHSQNCHRPFEVIDLFCAFRFSAIDGMADDRNIHRDDFANWRWWWWWLFIKCHSTHQLILAKINFLRRNKCVTARMIAFEWTCQHETTNEIN